jgi:ribosome-associated protein
MENMNFSPKDNIDKSSSKEKDSIPEDEIEFQFSRSSGKGGQNVNKVETKVEIRFNIDRSKAFSNEEKEKIKKSLANRINKEGDLMVVSEEKRNQLENRRIALERLDEMIKEVLKPEEERISTKPSKSVRERRLKEKKIISKKKKLRQKNFRIEEK